MVEKRPKRVRGALPGQRYKYWAALLPLLVAGAVFRFHFVFAHSSFMQSDEAIVGLMAKHITSRGELPVFFYGEERNGAQIAYLVAPFFYLFGSSNLVFKSVTTALSLVFASLLYLLAKRIGGQRLAVLSLTLTLFGPPFFIMWSVHASAQYLVMMVCGVCSLLLCDHILFTETSGTGRRWTPHPYLAFGLLGLTMGVGFWASPAMVSFMGAIWIVLWLRDRKCFFRTTFLGFAVFFAVGSLPALLYNALPDLRAAGGLPGASNWVSYASLFSGSEESMWSRISQATTRLFELITISLPAAVGGSLWEYETDLLRRSIVVGLMGFWLAAVAYTLAARVRLWAGQNGPRRWRLTRLDATILQFLLTFIILAITQYGWLVREPRYLLPAFVFLPIAGAGFLSWLLDGRQAVGYSLLGLVLALNLGTSIWFSKSLDPDHGLWPKDEKLNRYLIESGIRHPVANYWIAYSLAFETDEKVIPIPIGRARFGMYESTLSDPAPTQYIFPKRQEDDPYFSFFSYGLGGPQWASQDFADYLQEIGVPPGAVEIHEFDHYVLYDVPHQYLDPSVIILPEDRPSTGYVTEGMDYVQGVIKPGDALIVNPPELAISPDRQRQIGKLPVYLVPEHAPLDPEVARERLETLVKQHGRLFVLFGDTHASDPTGFVEEWLNRYAYRADDRWVGDLRLVIYGTGAWPPAQEPNRVWEVLLGEEIELVGSELDVERRVSGDIVPLSLFWRAQRPVEGDLKVFVHMLDVQGRLVAQRDSEPLGGLRPTSTWSAGERLVDRYGILLPDGLPSGEYQLVVGMYDPTTGDRLPATAPGLVVSGDHVRVGTVHVGP